MLVTLTSDDSCYGVITPKMEADALDFLAETLPRTSTWVEAAVVQSCRNIPTKFLITSEYTLAINVTFIDGIPSDGSWSLLEAQVNGVGCGPCEAWARRRVCPRLWRS